jgi:hypothetical protein
MRNTYVQKAKIYHTSFRRKTAASGRRGSGLNSDPEHTSKHGAEPACMTQDYYARRRLAADPEWNREGVMDWMETGVGCARISTLLCPPPRRPPRT